jgi:predicted DNA-binding transcriptional regulator AlpA
MEDEPMKTVTNELLIDSNGVAKMLNVSKRHVERMAQLGDLPPPVRLGKRIVRWRVAEIQDWVANLAIGEV